MSSWQVHRGAVNKLQTATIALNIQKNQASLQNFRPRFPTPHGRAVKKSKGTIFPENFPSGFPFYLNFYLHSSSNGYLKLMSPVPLVFHTIVTVEIDLKNAIKTKTLVLHF